VEFVKFKELEERIRALVGEHALLRKKNKELEERFEKELLEVEEAKNKIRALNEERDAVRTKVDALLELLQGIDVPK
jgi:chromosome segregation ATPase